MNPMRNFWSTARVGIAVFYLTLPITLFSIQYARQLFESASG